MTTLFAVCIKQLILLILTILFSSVFLFSQTQERFNANYDISHLHLIELGKSSTAALTLLPCPLISLSFRNQFLLKELMEKRIDFTYFYQNNLFAFRTEHFGYSKYGEMKLSSGYGRIFAGRFAVAMQFHYLFRHAYEYPSEHSFTFDLSFQAKIKENFGFGVEIYNPAGLKYEVIKGDIIPRYFSINLYHKMSAKILLWSKIEKYFPGSFDIIIGANFRISPFILSGSVSLSHLQCNILLSWRSFYFDLQTQYHYRLGFSPALRLHYLF